MRSSASLKPVNTGASFGLKAAAVGALLFLHFPIAVIILYAFTTEEAAFTFPPATTRAIALTTKVRTKRYMPYQ